MKRAAIFISLTLFAFTGCEVVTDTNGLPYEDLIVVKGVVQDGQPVDSIYFGHTLPLSVAYNSAQAILSNVSGSIAVDGVQYPLQYADSGYYNCPGLIGHAGKTYTLDASWNGKHVHGETTVPIPPVIDSVYVIPNGADTNMLDTTLSSNSIYGTLFAHVISTNGSVLSLNYDYRSAYFDHDTLSIDSEWFTGVFYGDQPIYFDSTSNGITWVNSYFTKFWISPPSRPKLPFRADVYSYDPAYYNYVRTHYISEDNSGIFSSGSGQNPDWNISGDGFGIFIGVSEAMKIFTY